MAGWHFEEIFQHLKKKKNAKKISNLSRLPMCVCKAFWSGLECLQVFWKGRESSWKMGVIAQLSNKGTVEI